MAYPQNVDNRVFRVIVNRRGQCSICPVGFGFPPEWQDTGKTGTRDECLAYISASLSRGVVQSVSSEKEGQD